MKKVIRASENTIHINNSNIRESNVYDAEKVLIDNGFDEDDAQVVLQAIGYVLLDTELYPED